MSSSFGQSFLVKKRNNEAIKSIEWHPPINETQPKKAKEQLDTHQIEIELPVVSNSNSDDLDIDYLTSLAIATNFDPKVIGTHLIDLSHSNLGVNGAIAYSAIISKALSARKKRTNK
ncbi:hypothetical protein [uncultured Aliivibrio sp.]|uniref:hypothetical protein n=1 Tax=uncultured Aliivibrio sp. TaxID=873085 RepID=UPI002611B857|nr:hypothetical protein [uncultured Aliivibrio sp.]